MESFWDFSGHYYALPGVADSCLKLQDDYNLDVNLVLFCIWFGKRFGELNAQEIDEAIDFSTTWSANVVQPLRAARRWLKNEGKLCNIPQTDIEQFRNRVKALELGAEHLQQNRLEILIQQTDPGQNGSLKAGEINLRNYIQLQAIELDDALNEHLSKLLAAAS